jgi:predicted  nucleic acid-binding Zn-ribbon protein
VENTERLEQERLEAQRRIERLEQECSEAQGQVAQLKQEREQSYLARQELLEKLREISKGLGAEGFERQGS